MHHSIPITQLTKQIGPHLNEMVVAIEACVHCGFCLPVCPTYQVLGSEMDSPRGRIYLMKAALEGELTFQEVMPYIDHCLGCLACVTACPSGVRYGELLAPFRAYARKQVGYKFTTRMQRLLVNETLPYPGRFRMVATVGRLAKPMLGALPGRLGGMLSLLPDHLPASLPLPPVMKAEGQRRARVGLLVGCVQHVIAPEINWATLRVLARNGVEVVIPPGQVCCGALLMHEGDYQGARNLAQQNLAVFGEDLDFILTNAAGCGSGMKEYGLLFKGTQEELEARDFSQKVQDVSQFLADLGMVEVSFLPRPLKVAYHDACHLAHAQGISASPRRLLESIPNLTLVEIIDGSLCCGSAGTYNLEQPEIAAELGRRKAENIIQSGGEAVVMGNIGCIVQIRTRLQALGKQLPVFHTFELLDLAYSQRSP